MTIRCTSNDAPVNGDLVPLRTPLGNIVWTELLDDHWLLNPYDENSDWVQMYDSKALLYFIDWLEFRRKNKFDNIIITSGLERTGKSMCTVIEKRIYDSPLYRDKERLAELLNRDNWTIEDFLKESPIKIDQICFDLPQYHEQIAKCVENAGDFTILDEAGYRLFALEWWSKNQIELVKEFQVIGKRRIITNLNVPHKDDLNNRIRDRRVTIWQHIFTRMIGDKVDRGYVEIRDANPDKWKLQVYWNPLLVCRFPGFEDSEWHDVYESTKDKFITEIINQQCDVNEANAVTGKKENRYLREANMLIEMMHQGHNGKDGWDYTEIAHKLGIGKAALSLRMKKEHETQLREMEYQRIQNEKEKEKEMISELSDSEIEGMTDENETK